MRYAERVAPAARMQTALRDEFNAARRARTGGRAGSGGGNVLTTPLGDESAVPFRAAPTAPFWFAAVALAFLTYAPALNNYFIADDFNWVVEAGRTWEHPANIFALVIANFFRPIVHLWFAAMRAVAGEHAAPYYVAAIVAHGLNCGVVAWATARLTRDRLAGGIAGCFFVVHFTHFDAVYWLSAISDIIGTSLTATAIVCAAEAARGRHRWGWGALALTPLVLGCKESMVMVLPLLIWTVWQFRAGGRPLTRHAGWLLSTAAVWIAYLAMQLHVQATSPHITTGYYAVGTHPPRMLLNAIVNFVVPNRYLVGAPVWAVTALAAALLGGATLATARLRPGQGRTAAFFLGWVLLAFFPCSFFKNYDRIPSRYSYLPSVACAGFLGWLGAAWWRARAPWTLGRRTAVWVGIAGVVALNVAYVWRIDRVRYEVHSRVSKQVLWRMRHDRATLTPETTIVATNVGLPHRGLHFEPALELFVGRRVRRFITVAEGEALPADVVEPALWYHWDAEAERLIPQRPAGAGGGG